MEDYERLLTGEFDCERKGKPHFMPLFGLPGTYIPKDDVLKYDVLADACYTRIMMFEGPLRLRQTRKSILYNHRFVLNIWLDDELIFSTESEKFNNIREKLKFNNTESSKEKFRYLLNYMMAVQFYPSSLSWSVDGDTESGLQEKGSPTKNDTEVHDVFSDIQKVKMLEGMESGHARNLAKSFFAERKWNDRDLNDVNQFVGKALKRYGYTLLQKLIDLQRMPTHLKNVTRVFTFFEKKYFSKIRISLDENNEFVVENNSNSDTISCFKSGKKIHEVKKDGSLKSNTDYKRFDPTLALFIAFINDPIDQIVYFGADTKRCSFCNLPLEDPKSLAVGYGKQCAETHDIPWG